jgi:hypothetical protein
MALLECGLAAAVRVGWVKLSNSHLEIKKVSVTLVPIGHVFFMYALRLLLGVVVI